MIKKAAAVIVLAALIPTHTEAEDFSDLFRKVDPTVVVLYTVERSISRESPVRAVAQPGLGSGFLIDGDGHVMTAAHVVQTADLVEAEFLDGTKVTAAVVTSDPINDVALLKLDEVPDGAVWAQLGDSDDVRVGDEIFVIGAPLGLNHTLTVGHISARHEQQDSFMAGIRAETFQTDAAINQGNSGGPMFNREGEVVGVVSHIRSLSGGSDGLGFAVTSNAAVDALFENRMPWSGVSGIVVSGELAAALNVPQSHGFLVQKVALNSPAARVGLKPSRLLATILDQELLIGGDIVLAVDGIQISPDFGQLFREKVTDENHPATIELTVLRAGETINLAAPFRRR